MTQQERWRVNGIDLAVRAAGSGPLVVLAHGFPDLGISWRLQVDTLVAAGYRVVVPDLRGYGDSDRPTAPAAYYYYCRAAAAPSAHRGARRFAACCGPSSGAAVGGSRETWWCSSRLDAEHL